jgi:predicted NBD/HSP70 family sugar kinase
VSLAEAQQSGRGNSTDHVRRHNLAVVLGLVHRSQGISRSQLTRLTGLNRSTVAALVGELVERQLVLEVDADVRNQVGRPSPVVKPSPLAVGIAINPEIDAITIAVVGLGGQVLTRIRHVTDHEPTAHEAVEICARVIAELRGELEACHRVVGIGLAIPGLVRSLDGVVRLAPHLGWVDEPVAAMLSEATGYTVVAGNDARLGTLAESTFGAGRDLTDFIYLNGGASGIGGGIIAGGQAITGAAGHAGELGHTLVNSNGVVCHCGGVGCLETEVRRAPLLALLGLDDADSDDLEGALLASESAEVTAEVHRQLDFLAVALRNAINTLNPQRILLGGFLGALYAVAPAHLNTHIAHQPLRASREGVTIGRAALGSNLLMIGAAELAFSAVLADPAAF